MLLVETALDAFDDATIAALTASLPSSWRQRVERYKPLQARRLSCIGYTLLRQILQEQYRMEALPAIVVDEHGKPSFQDCPLFFSISHCKVAVACIVDDRPIAVDVQDRFTKLSPALAARIAAPRSVQTMDAAALTALWTQKEASAKLDGRGLSIGLENLPMKGHEVETVEENGFIISIAK